MSEWWGTVNTDGHFEVYYGTSVKRAEVEKHASWLDTEFPSDAPHRAVLVTDRGITDAMVEKLWQRDRELSALNKGLPVNLEAVARVEELNHVLRILGLIDEFRDRVFPVDRARFEKEKEDGK